MVLTIPILPRLLSPSTLHRLPAAAAIGLRGATLLLSVLSVTLLAPFLGPEDLGRFAVLQAVAAWMGLAGCGLMEACSGILGKFQRAGVRHRGKRYLDGALRIASIACMAVAVVVSLALAVVAVTQEVGMSAVAPWIVACALPLMAVPFTLTNAPLNAEGAIGRNTAWSFAVVAAGLAALFTVIHIPMFDDHRLLAAITATGVSTLLVRVVMYHVEMRRLYGNLSTHQVLSQRQLKGLLATSYPFIVITAAALAAFQVDRIIAFTFLPAGDVARLDVTSKVFLAFHTLYAVFLAKLWHSVGQPWNQGDRPGAQRALLRAARRALLFWCAAGSVLVFALDPIVETLTRGTVVIKDPPFVVLVAVFLTTRTVVDTFSIALFAMRRQRQTVRTVIAHGLLNIPCSILGGLWFGLAGIVAGQIAALVLTSGWHFPLLFWRATARGAI